MSAGWHFVRHCRVATFCAKPRFLLGFMLWCLTRVFAALKVKLRQLLT